MYLDMSLGGLMLMWCGDMVVCDLKISYSRDVFRRYMCEMCAAHTLKLYHWGGGGGGGGGFGEGRFI